jgi:hypothetical protein
MSSNSSPSKAPVSIKRSSDFAGGGCVIQGLGLLAPLVGCLGGVGGLILGVFVGLLLLAVGSGMSVRLVCGGCGNRVDNKTVTLCPTCRAELVYKSSAPTAMVLIFIIIAVVVGSQYWTKWLAEG